MTLIQTIECVCGAVVDIYEESNNTPGWVEKQDAVCPVSNCSRLITKIKTDGNLVVKLTKES